MKGVCERGEDFCRLISKSVCKSSLNYADVVMFFMTRDDVAARDLTEMLSFCLTNYPQYLP